ncbi:hypothetical protein D9M69_532770 [compost metagenome]
MAGLGRVWICARAELNHAPDKQSQNQQCDWNDKPERIALKPMNLLSNTRRSFLKSYLPWTRLIRKSGTARPQQCESTNDGTPRCGNNFIHQNSLPFRPFRLDAGRLDGRIPRQRSNHTLTHTARKANMFLCGIFARNPASEPRIPIIQESFTGARVVDLKFLSFGWHLRSGTSNP